MSKRSKSNSFSQMAYGRFRRRGYALGMRRRRFGGPMRRRYGRRRPTVYHVRAPRPEVKKTDITVQDASMDIGGTVVKIFDPAAGVTPITLIGNKAQIRYLNWRCRLNADIPVASAATVAPNLRVVIFRDTQGVAGATPAWTDVFQSASILSSLKIDTIPRFKIISDRQYTMNAGLANVGANANTITRFYKFFKRLNFPFYTESATQEPRRNGLYCAYITDVDEVGAIDAVARVGFVDN